MSKQLIVIAGPTASGKTDLSVVLAKEWNTVVISGDSRQFYKEMSIGTAKPTSSEMQGIKHYFIDSHSIKNEINAAHFAKEAEILLQELFKNNDKVILTGGSGMFLDALCFGLDDIPHSKEVQEELNWEFKQKGLEQLKLELLEKDPEYYSIVDLQNPIRIIRALEVIRITGTPYSILRKGSKKVNDFDINYFVLDVPRDTLYNRINLRVDNMIKAGLEEEVKSLINYRDLKPLSTVGYSEWFQFFDNSIDRNTCIELIKQNSRRYAKRQVTWFKRNPDAIWVNFGSTQEMKNTILKSIQ